MKIERNVTIDSDPETVFRHIAEPDLLKSWIKTMENFRFVSTVEGGDLEGAEFAYDAGGSSFEGKVIDYQPVSKYTAFFSSSGYEYTDRFILTPDGAKTVVTGDMEIRFKTLLWKIIGKFLSASIKTDSVRNMGKLKAAVESFDKNI